MHGNRARVALTGAALVALGGTGCSSGNAINTGPFGNGGMRLARSADPYHRAASRPRG